MCRYLLPHLMLAAATDLKNAEKVKQYLQHHHLLHPDYLMVREFGKIYFPLLKKGTVPGVKTIPGAKVINTSFSFPEKKKPLTINQLLNGKLTEKELRLLPRSQERIGKIMILEIPTLLRKKEKVIAETFLKANNYIETVVRKDRAHGGEYRTRAVKVLAGKNTKETLHRENGVMIKVNLETTYFTARLAHERLRIAQQVRKGEDVLVMFSGVAPYPLVLAKHSSAQHIDAVEINPLAHRLAVDNIALNNLQHKIVLFLGDVRQVVPSLKKKFDRIVMPLPKTGEQFLDLAWSVSRPGTIIHLYAFLKEAEIPAEAAKIRKQASSSRHSVSVLRAVPCGQFAPRVFRVCFDLKVRG